MSWLDRQALSDEGWRRVAQSFADRARGADRDERLRKRKVAAGRSVGVGRGLAECLVEQGETEGRLRTWKEEAVHRIQQAKHGYARDEYWARSAFYEVKRLQEQEAGAAVAPAA